MEKLSAIMLFYESAVQVGLVESSHACPYRDRAPKHNTGRSPCRLTQHCCCRLRGVLGAACAVAENGFIGTWKLPLLQIASRLAIDAPFYVLLAGNHQLEWNASVNLRNTPH